MPCHAPEGAWSRARVGKVTLEHARPVLQLRTVQFGILHRFETAMSPPAPELLLPVLEIIPLQLLAYHIAGRRGCDVDQPRNLAKSVTVE